MEFGLVIALGLVLGSFLNVCIYRIPKGESIVFPPSHCTNCNHKLKALDLIPVLGYIILRGKCRYCKEKISLRYLIIECLNSTLYLIIYLKFGLTILAVKYCVLSSILIVIGMIDYDTQFVFTNTTILGATTGVIFILVQGIYYKAGVADLVLGGVIGFAIIGLIVIITKGMGEGDVEIAAVCGMFLGIKGILLGLFLGIVIGGMIGSIILILKLKKAKERIAFGPFIAIGCFVSMVWNTEILKYYFSLLS